MKKTTLIILLLGFTAISAQRVSDYRYITIPEKFAGFKNNDYGLPEMLSAVLKNKNYTVLSSDQGEWPSEASVNVCSVLSANVINDSGLLRNRILVQFKNCNNVIVASQKGSSNIKEFEEGYQDALKAALKNVPASNPVAAVALTNDQIQQVATAKKEKVKTSEMQMQTVKNQEEVKAVSTGAEMYSYKGTQFQKVQLGTDQFILTYNNPKPFATFSATGKGDVYRVTMENGQMGIGYYENNDLIIETADSHSQSVKLILTKN